PASTSSRCAPSPRAWPTRRRPSASSRSSNRPQPRRVALSARRGLADPGRERHDRDLGVDAGAAGEDRAVGDPDAIDAAQAALWVDRVAGRIGAGGGGAGGVEAGEAEAADVEALD